MAGVGKEDAVHAGQRGQLVAELALQRDVVEIGGVQQGAGLATDRLADSGMGVAEATDRDTRKRIEVTFAVTIPQPGTFAARKADRQSLVGGHQCLRHPISLPAGLVAAEKTKGSPAAAGPPVS